MKKTETKETIVIYFIQTLTGREMHQYFISTHEDNLNSVCNTIHQNLKKEERWNRREQIVTEIVISPESGKILGFNNVFHHKDGAEKPELDLVGYGHLKK